MNRYDLILPLLGIAICVPLILMGIYWGGGFHFHWRYQALIPPGDC